MGNRGAYCADNSYRPTNTSTHRTGKAIASSSKFGLANSYVDLPFHRVEPSDVGRRSELQYGTLISVGDIVEMTNGHIMKVRRIWRDNLGVVMLLGELSVPHDERLPTAPNAVFWSYYTTNGFEEHYLEHNLVELCQVRRLRRLLMIVPDSLVSGTIQQQTPNPFSDPPDLICGWKHITLGSANGESAEESFRPLTASEADIALASHNCDHSQYGSMPELSSFSELAMSNPVQLRQYTFGVLHGGSGGMSRGAEQAGLCVSWGLDRDPCATAAFGMNFPAAGISQMSDIDLCELYLQALPPVITDILHVSPPCQPFSNNHTIAGPNDEENRECLNRIRRILEIIKPRVVTFENVPGLMLRHKNWLNLVLHSFTVSGYIVHWKLVQCAKHGVPQTRKRLFIIAARLLSAWFDISFKPTNTCNNIEISASSLMAYALEILVAVAAIYLVSASLKAWSNRSRSRRATLQFGCQPAKYYPNWDPFLGLDLFAILRRADTRGQGSQAYADLHRRYGNTFEMKALSDSVIQTADPQNIQAVSATKFNDFGVGPLRGKIGAPFLDGGVFTEDGEFWKHSRALIRPTFNRVEIADLDSFERHVSRFLALFPKDSTAFDIQPLTKKLFLDTSSEFLFGRSIESLLPQTPFDTEEFMKAFDYSLLGLALRLLAGPLKLLFLLDPTWKKAYTKVHTFVDKHVSNAIEMQKADTNNNQDSSNAGRPKKYILLHEMARSTQDPLELRAQILNVFIPARDTAAIAFGNIIFELARHPQTWRDLRTEILAAVSPPQQVIDFDLLKNLRFCKAVINETLRLHPPVSRIPRVALRDTVLPVGGGSDEKSPLFVPKGRLVEMDLYTVQRDPQIWGPDAQEFRPDRWGEGRPLWEAKWQYEPFLGGLRMCPAQGQVLLQLTYLLVRVAQNFRGIENRDEEIAYLEETKLTSESRNGVKIALIPA